MQMCFVATFFNNYTSSIIIGIRKNRFKFKCMFRTCVLERVSYSLKFSPDRTLCLFYDGKIFITYFVLTCVFVYKS